MRHLFFQHRKDAALTSLYLFVAAASAVQLITSALQPDFFNMTYFIFNLFLATLAIFQVFRDPSTQRGVRVIIFECDEIITRHWFKETVIHWTDVVTIEINDVPIEKSNRKIKYVEKIVIAYRDDTNAIQSILMDNREKIIDCISEHYELNDTALEMSN